MPQYTKVSEVLNATARFFTKNKWTTGALSRYIDSNTLGFCVLGGISAVVTNEQDIRDNPNDLGKPEPWFKDYRLILRSAAYFARWLIKNDARAKQKIEKEINDLKSRSHKALMEGVISWNDGVLTWEKAPEKTLVKYLRAAAKQAKAEGK